MSVSSGFISRPVATSLLMVAIVALGVIGYVSLPVAALPSVDFPTIQVTAQLPGARPADRGRDGGDAVGAAVRRNPRPLANDLEQRHGLCRNHAAVRPRPDHRLRRRRRAGGHQCRGRAVAGRTAQPANLPQDEPGRPTDSADLDVIGHAANNQGQRLRQLDPGAEDFPSAGRRPCRCRRAAGAGHPNPA